MQWSRSMWSIGIKSGVITVLGLLAYGLVVQTLGWHHPLLENLAYGVMALGIYSGHYHYKAARQGLMTYREGLQLGLIVSAFVGIVQGLLIYVHTKYIDLAFIDQLMASIQVALQKRNLDEASVATSVRFLQQYVTPFLLSISTSVSTVLMGLVLTLIIAAYARSPGTTSNN
ncbi:MAG: DUF4199 domain-containing protein [Roseivirga sp.]